MSALRLRSRLPHIVVLAMIGLLTSAGAAHASTDPGCRKGEFCVWPSDGYGGKIQRFDLRSANTEECLPLPEGFDGASFANLMTRDVTVYQDGECSTEGDFVTYPGGGTYVPNAPFLVRGIQIWE